MREILFRGKSDNGYWIYGNLNFYPDINRTFIRKNNKELLPSFQTSLEEEVDHETVGQYTGLTDKNGTKIFEGDIVKLFMKDGIEIGAIGWSNIDLRYKFASPDGTAYGFDITDTFEIIGNIHDNPELLGGGVG